MPYWNWCFLTYKIYKICVYVAFCKTLNYLDVVVKLDSIYYFSKSYDFSLAENSVCQHQNINSCWGKILYINQSPSCSIQVKRSSHVTQILLAHQIMEHTARIALATWGHHLLPSNLRRIRLGQHLEGETLTHTVSNVPPPKDNPAALIISWDLEFCFVYLLHSLHTSCEQFGFQNPQPVGSCSLRTL